MTKRMEDNLVPIGEIQPDRVYRTTLCQQIFGYGPQRTEDLIKEDKLPKPIPLSLGSRFKAWTGRQILDHRAEMSKLAAVEKAPQPQPPQFAEAAKKRKLKLKPQPPVKSNKRQRERA